MTKRRLLAVIFVCTGLLSGEVAATRVFHRDLEEILALGFPVVQARVVSSREEIEPSQLTVYVEIDQIRPWRGTVEVPGTVVHRFSTMLERQGPNGEVMRVSPIRDGSGIERELQAGKEYFLVLDASGQYLIRAENLSSEARIRAVLGAP